ncbi:MAG: hypothetical protein QHH13_00440 [Melioribacter sp.]|uniref:hypothetical protein n=1 Tax=Rosettibacter primus TaxID=3111523 RepID=UPI00247BED30|nr:hypothetical protein [Melioribacter sp.]
MKIHIRDILIFSPLLILLSCNETKINDEQNFSYSICLAEFSSLSEAYNYKDRLNKNLLDSITIKSLSSKKYLILYGNYNNSYNAGIKAYELFNNYSIKDYKIFYKDNFVNDLFANFLFVANYSGRPSLYNFNLITKQTKPVWSRWGRKVLALNHSQDRSKVFITTALSYKKEGVFPVIKDVRLYLYDAQENKIDEIYSFGDCIQLYTYWETEDTFKVNLTFSDSIKSEIIIQNIFSFDAHGQLTQIQKRDFQILKDGFPKPPVLKPAVISPRGRFQIRNIKENGKSYIYLRDVTKNSEILIYEYEGILKNIIWTNDERFCFLIIKLNEVNRSELLIIDANEMRIRKNYYGPENMNLLVHGNFLFFDEQNYGIRQIAVYNLNKDSVYHRIQFYDGCGINNL